MGTAFCATCTCAGKIYVLGGIWRRKPTSACNYLDTALEAWQTVPSMVASRWKFFAIAFPEKVYVVGGQNSAYEDRIGEVLMSESNKWKLLPRLPNLHTHTAAAAPEGQLYLIRSWTTGTPKPCRVTCLDDAAKRWQPRWPATRSAVLDFLPTMTASIGAQVFLTGSRPKDLVSLHVESGLWCQFRNALPKTLLQSTIVGMQTRGEDLCVVCK